MKLNKKLKRTILKSIVSLIVVCFAVPAFAARIVAVHDEWAVSNTGFTQAGVANATTFSQNLASFLKGSAGAGRFLIYTDSFGIAENQFRDALTAVGHTVDFTLSAGNNLPVDLSIYDGLFLSGLPGNADATTLTNYANTDKGVFIAAGNGFTPGVEAGRWNGFLNNFGLSFESTYNGIQGNLPAVGTHPIISGVTQLYHDNGNFVTTTGSTPLASIILRDPSQGGLIGVYDSRAAAVPEPASMLLLGSAALGMMSRKRKAAK